MYKKVILFSIFLLFIINTQAQITFPYIKILYDSGWTYKNLQLIPIRYKDSIFNKTNLPAALLSLQQAMQQKKVQIKENIYAREPNVNTLTIKNLSKQYILVTNGEMIKGGKQDRMIAETKIIAPGKEAEYLNVFCIEKGRWSNKQQPFSYGGYANAKIRKAADSSGVQHHVWKEIDKQFELEKVEIPNSPLIQLMGKKKNILPDYVTFFMDKFTKSDSLNIGFIVLSDKKILGCDVFINESSMNTNFEKILHSYIATVTNTESNVEVDDKKLKDFCNQLFSSEVSQKKFLEHNGKAFTYNNKTIHITAY